MLSFWWVDIWILDSESCSRILDSRLVLWVVKREIWWVSLSVSVERVWWESWRVWSSWDLRVRVWAALRRVVVFWDRVWVRVEFWEVRWVRLDWRSETEVLRAEFWVSNEFWVWEKSWVRVRIFFSREPIMSISCWVDASRRGGGSVRVDCGVVWGGSMSIWQDWWWWTGGGWGASVHMVWETCSIASVHMVWSTCSVR